MPTTLIVGAGTFGASTAYHLSQTSSSSSPSDRVILLDRAPFPDDPLTTPPAAAPGASWDWNKIIRADYSDGAYTRIMVDGIREWAANPIFSPWYFPTGIVWFFPQELIDKIVANYGDRLPAGAMVMTGPEAQQREGWFSEAKLDQGQACMFNPEGGWAMAKEAVAATVRAAVAQGVEYVTGEVVKAVRETKEDGSGNSSLGRCVGVELADGSVIKADRVVVCMGVGAIRFLEASGPDLAVGKKLRAGGFLTACIKSGLDNQRFNKTSSIQKRDYEGGGFLPAGPRSPAKIYYDLPMERFAKLASSGNMVRAAPPGPEQDMWTAPPGPEQDMWTAPAKMRALLRETGALFVGDAAAAELEFENYRVCWDLSTADEDFVVSPLGGEGVAGEKKDAIEGLYMATSGGFHGFKFLPVIGKYVIDMLEGRLDEDLVKKWDWNRDRGEGWRKYGNAEEIGGLTIQG